MRDAQHTRHGEAYNRRRQERNEQVTDRKTGTGRHARKELLVEPLQAMKKEQRER